MTIMARLYQIVILWLLQEFSILGILEQEMGNACQAQKHVNFTFNKRSGKKRPPESCVAVEFQSRKALQNAQPPEPSSGG
jgi:hypothetical protein